MASVSTTQPAARTGWLSLRHRRYLIALLFVLPALLNFTVFRHVPILLAAHASLHEYS